MTTHTHRPPTVTVPIHTDPPPAIPAPSTPTTGPATASPVRIGDARPADTGTYLPLIAATTPGHPLPTNLGQVLSLRPGPPLSHGPILCLVAKNTHQHTVGALLGGVPKWVYEHPLCARTALPRFLKSRIAAIHAVAVHPNHRGQGIARKLIRAAERRFRQAGYQLLTLEHPPELTTFYEGLGYLSDTKLIMKLPGEDLLGQQSNGLRSAAKPLSSRVEIVHIPGAPARIVSGILPGCHISPTMRFTNGYLTS
ncbi:GNAT family N-acetyltransferase [Streptomyces sp. 8N706]|uniref:GNAT family N-acetyltransferase n=1 Tax=Streptomyces sp. 8N706 TaxID=3457416 RepID=UPI003FD56D3A